MAFITYPLNNIDYTAEDAELFHCTRTSGIWAKDSFSISVTGADNNVTVGKGIAWINNKEFSGKVAALKTSETRDMGVADSTYPRIDVIAIQYNVNNNATDIVVKKGVAATNPVMPAIVRSGAIHELYLARIYRPAGSTAITASNITDLRMDSNVCGLMADSVTQVDMEAIRAQLMGLVDDLTEAINNIVVNEIVPVIKGGTGASTPAEALKNLGCCSIEELWRNARPYDSFGVQEIENIVPEDCHLLIVMFRSKEGRGIISSIGIKGETNEINWAGARRYWSATYENSLFLREAYDESGSINNKYLIPYIVYGIKGVQ